MSIFRSFAYLMKDTHKTPYTNAYLTPTSTGPGEVTDGYILLEGVEVWDLHRLLSQGTQQPKRESDHSPLSSPVGCRW